MPLLHTDIACPASTSHICLTAAFVTRIICRWTWSVLYVPGHVSDGASPQSGSVLPQDVCSQPTVPVSPASLLPCRVAALGCFRFSLSFGICSLIPNLFTASHGPARRIVPIKLCNNGPRLTSDSVVFSHPVGSR